jgi:hypothetical protein
MDVILKNVDMIINILIYVDNKSIKSFLKCCKATYAFWFKRDLWLFKSIHDIKKSPHTAAEIFKDTIRAKFDLFYDNGKIDGFESYLLTLSYFDIHTYGYIRVPTYDYNCIVYQRADEYHEIDRPNITTTDVKYILDHTADKMQILQFLSKFITSNDALLTVLPFPNDNRCVHRIYYTAQIFEHICKIVKDRNLSNAPIINFLKTEVMIFWIYTIIANIYFNAPVSKGHLKIIYLSLIKNATWKGKYIDASCLMQPVLINDKVIHTQSLKSVKCNQDKFPIWTKTSYQFDKVISLLSCIPYIREYMHRWDKTLDEKNYTCDDEHFYQVSAEYDEEIEYLLYIIDDISVPWNKYKNITNLNDVFKCNMREVEKKYKDLIDLHKKLKLHKGEYSDLINVIIRDIEINIYDDNIGDRNHEIWVYDNKICYTSDYECF